MSGNFLWLVYKRIRVGFAFMGFILMYSFYTVGFNNSLLLVALSVFFAELFGACYNDSQDFKEDVLNKRYDKLTVSGVLGTNQMERISLLLAFLCIFVAAYSSFLPFAFIYLMMAWAYSNPKIRLKKYNIYAYFSMGFVWLLIPIYLGFLFRGNVYLVDILFGSFFFFQYTYLLSQKDSTDLKDETNLFIEKGVNKSVFICGILAFFSSMFLLLLSIPHTSLVLIWGLNSLVKILQTRKVSTRKINRETRSKFTLLEFLTPYFYIGGVFFVGN